MTWVIGLLLTLVLLYSHGHAYVRGFLKGERNLYYRFYRPKALADQRFLRSINEASLEGSAAAQQRNVQLLARNRRLQQKSIRLAVKYGAATKELRRTKTDFSEVLSRMLVQVANLNRKSTP